ncbi:rim15, signal transduction response regulator [Dipsacomyces acuminosporus]|nr:rim15, signal transduction response regulator [Dipsacomyces acuminosporus]
MPGSGGGTHATSASAPSLSAPRKSSYSNQAAQIRTCPIPEKLRLQIVDTTQDSVASSSPTAISPTYTSVDSGKMTSMHRRPSRRSLQGSDGVTMRRTSGHDHPVSDRPVAAPVAKRTNSTNSTWSTVTPTSPFGTADSMPANLMGTQNDSVLLPDWDASYQPLARSRTRGRRYSVFDMSFASQRPLTATPDVQKEVEANSSNEGVGGAHRRMSLKSSPGTVPPAEVKGGVHSRRRTEPLSTRPNLRESTPPWLNTSSSAVSPSAELGSQPPYIRSNSVRSGKASPKQFHLNSCVQSRDQRRQSISYANIRTISKQSSFDSPSRISGQNTPFDHGSTRRRKHRPLSSDYHDDSSSGQSTPSNLLFTRLHRRSSSSIQATGLVSKEHGPNSGPRPRRQRKGLECRTNSPGRPDDKSAEQGCLKFSRRSVSTVNARRANTLSRYHSNKGLFEGDDDGEDMYQADLECDHDLDLPYLRFSTSTPEVAVMPSTLHPSSQLRAAKKPDLFYERLLFLSRSIKARRWKHRRLSMHRAAGISSHKDAEGRRAQQTGIMSPSRPSQSQHRSTDGDFGLSSEAASKGAGDPNKHHHRDCDPADLINWRIWTEDIPCDALAALHRRASEMWHRIAHSWKRRHSNQGSRYLERRRSSSISNRGASSGPIKPGTVLTSGSAKSISATVPAGGPLDVKGVPQSSGSTAAVLNPYLMDPTCLQRGFSESGRQTSPNDAFAAMFQMPHYSPIDMRQNVQTAISPRDPSGLAPGAASQFPVAKSTKSEGSEGSTSSRPGQQARASHLQLNIVKEQPLEHLEERTDFFLQGSSANDKGTSISSPGAQEKHAWLFARLENPDEAVESLLVFQSRLRVRLAKAKAESEEELVSIIQDLGEFVEEGLSYVNEDDSTDDGFVYDNDGSVASDECYLDEEPQPLDGGVSEAPAAGVSSAAGGHGCISALQHESARHASMPAPGLLSATGNTDSTAWGLKSLNKKLRDVLSFHNNNSSYIADQDALLTQADQPKDPASITGIYSTQSPERTIYSSEFKTSRPAQHASPNPKLNRSPSIRRLAFLKALSNDRTSSAASSSESDPSGHWHHYNPLQIANSKQADYLSMPSLGHAGQNEYGSDSTLEHALSMVADAHDDSADGSKTPSITASSQQQQVPETLNLDNCSISAPLEPACHEDSWSISPRDVARQSTSSICSSDMLSSATPSDIDSSYKHGRSHSHSHVGRCISRASQYSAGSGTSLLTSPLIAEDEFKPTPFLRAIMELVSIIGHVISMSASEMMKPLSETLLDEAMEIVGSEESETLEDEKQRVSSLMPTEYLVQRLTELGYQWEQPQSQICPGGSIVERPWPCRGFYFRALLAISSLNRIVMWYIAVRSMFAEDIIEELDKRSGLHHGADASQNPQKAVGQNLPDSLDLGADRLGIDLGDARQRVPIQGKADGIANGDDSAANQPCFGQRPARNTSSKSADGYKTTQESTDNAPSSDSACMHVQRRDDGGGTIPASVQQQGSSSLLQSATAVDQGLNILMEVSLDGRVRYVSPAWQRLLGSDPEELVDCPVSAIFDAEDVQVCRSAVEQLLADNTRTVETTIKVHCPDYSAVASVEAKGMLIYNRSRNEPSHVLWVLRFVSAIVPIAPPPPSESSTSTELAIGKQSDTASIRGAPEDVAHELAGDREAGDEQPPLPPSSLESITCRICDRAIPANYFEEHSWLCAQSHRFAMDVELQNDRLGDIKAQLQTWYPGCSLIELEEMVHGETDPATVRERAQQQAKDIGGYSWQRRVDGGKAAVRSMIDVCTKAMLLSDSDVIPKCDFPRASGKLESSDGDPKHRSDDFDLVHSENWDEVAAYSAPALGFRDAALESLSSFLAEAVKKKLGAIDDLQYAIIDSSIACSKWLIPVEDMVADFALQPGPPHQEHDAASIRCAGNGEAGAKAEESTAMPSCGLTSSSIQSQQPDSVMPVPSSAASGEVCGSPRSPEMYSQPPSSAFSAVTPVSRRPSTSIAAPLRIATSNLGAPPGWPVAQSGIRNSALLATPTVPSIQDFVLLKPISKGAYGSVFLAKKRSTGEYYAIKVLKKADMIAKNQISNVKAERAIMMAQTGSPFVVRLLFTFQSRTSLYLVMEYLNGGDCASLLKAIGTLSEDWARQYLAEVVLGVEDLHRRNVVHRDLKPDNLLIDSEGHLKLTDFGLSKLGFLGRRVDQQTMSHSFPASDASQRVSATAVMPEPAPSSGVWKSYVSSPVSASQPLSAAGAGAEVASRVDIGDSFRSSSAYKPAMTQVAMALPSISTPLPVKRDNCSSYNAYHASAIGEAGESSEIRAPDPMAAKRVAKLKEEDASASGTSASVSSGSSGGSTAGSSLGAASGSSATPAPPGCAHKHALGTPDYIAPESIMGLESGESVDWWAVGVICYEFLFGVPPFHGDTPAKVFSNILSTDIEFYDDLREDLRREKEGCSSGQGLGEGGEEEDDGTGIPDISPEARDFITRLLCRDPKKRLGYNGAGEVKLHPFFKDINWATLLDTQPAFVPQVDDIEDTEYFDLRGAVLDPEQPDLRPKEPPLPPAPETTPGSQGHQATAPQHEHRLSEIGNGTALHRPKTTPTMPLGGSQTLDDGKASRGALAIQPPPSDESIPILQPPHHEHEAELPPLDEEPKFGGFTFKNLHALEQANFNEIVKLRRRSTLIGLPSHQYPRSDAQSTGSHSQSTAPGTPSTLPASYRHRSYLGSSISSIHSMQSDMSCGLGSDSSYSQDSHSLLLPNTSAAFAAGGSAPRTGLGRHNSWDNHSGHVRNSLSTAIPPARASTFASPRTMPFFGDDESDGHGCSIGRSGAGRIRSSSASREIAPHYSHARSSSGSSHRGSLLNPGTELASQVRYSQRHVIATSPPQNTRPSAATHATPTQIPQLSPPILRRSHTVSSDSWQQQQNQQQAQHVLAAQMQSRICLVADDNPVCCKIMEIILRRMHLECVVVRNGAEAIRCALGRTAFRAIFMDVGMPIVDGDEAARMIKSTYNANRDTPIIAMTTYEGESTDALYDGAIVKPVTLQHVKRSLGEHGHV